MGSARGRRGQRYNINIGLNAFCSSIFRFTRNNCICCAIIVWHRRRSSSCKTTSRSFDGGSSSVPRINGEWWKHNDSKRFIDTYLFCRKSTVILIPFSASTRSPPCCLHSPLLLSRQTFTKHLIPFMRRRFLLSVGCLLLHLPFDSNRLVAVAVCSAVLSSVHDGLTVYVAVNVMKPNPIRQLLCHLKCRKRSTCCVDAECVARASPFNGWWIDHALIAHVSHALTLFRMNFLLFDVWTNPFYLWHFTACVVSRNMRPVLIPCAFFRVVRQHKYTYATAFSHVRVCVLLNVKCDNRKQDSKSSPKWYDWTIFVRGE